MRKNDLPHNALLHHVATSEAIIAFVAFVLRDARKESLIFFAVIGVPTICQRAVAVLGGPCEVQLADDMPPLRILPGGLVEGLASVVCSRHTMVWQTWQQEWMAMHEQGHLSSQPSDPTVLLQDLVKFCFEIDRRRRAMDKHIWTRDSQAGATLHCVQSGLVRFLSSYLDEFVLNHFVHQHDCSEAVPSRRRSGGGQVPKRMTMSVDTIFDLVEHARDAGLSMRESLNFLRQTPRLSHAAGCHPNVTDAWMRRYQAIYDDATVIAFAGTNHVNLVADSSRHSGKEVLVTVAWSWENRTAAVCPIQVIMLMDAVAPGEMDLTNLIEKLAQDLAIERLEFSVFLYNR